MRRNWPVDNASMISDYHGVVSGVGCCDGEVGMSGFGALPPAYLSDPTLIIGYWTNSKNNPMSPGATFVVTKDQSAPPEQLFGPGTFSATDPQTGKLAPGLAAYSRRVGVAITVAGVVTVLGLALFAMRSR